MNIKNEWTNPRKKDDLTVEKKSLRYVRLICLIGRSGYFLAADKDSKSNYRCPASLFYEINSRTELI